MTSRISWLHLSDIHFLPRTSWKSAPARALLLRLLERLRSEGRVERPDLVFCTGDIAFGHARSAPMPQQYAQAKEFFDQVLGVFNLPKDRLVMVPGNHDVRRDRINQDAQVALTGYARDSRQHVEAINQRFENLEQSQRDALRRLDEYRSFVTSYLPDSLTDDDRVTTLKVIELAGRRVGIVGLNSAWSCAGEEDDRNLWVAAQWQLDRAELALADTELRIALMHHPVDWVNEAERDLLTRRLAGKFHFFLHGHSHNQWIDPGQDCVKIGAGAVGADKQGEFGINFVELDVSSLQGVMHGWGYSPVDGEWRELHLPNQAAPGRSTFKFRLEEVIGHGSSRTSQPDPPARASIATASSAPRAQLATGPATEDVSRSSDTAPSPVGRPMYGRERLLRSARDVLSAAHLLVLYGMRGNGKSRLIDSLTSDSSVGGRRAVVHVLASQTLDPQDIFREVCPRLGITDETPTIEIDSVDQVVAELSRRSVSPQPTTVWIDRAHLLFAESGWKNPRLAILVSGLRQVTGSAWTWILELRERPPEGVFPASVHLEVPGLPKAALGEWISEAAPASAGEAWRLSGDRLTAMYQWLGGGHGQQAHPLAISLLVELARGLGVSPVEVRERFLAQAEDRLEQFLIADLFERVLSDGERNLLLALGLYRGYVPHDHAEPLERALSAAGAWRGLDRRCLLAADANQERFFLHGFISGWLRQRLGYAADGLDDAEVVAKEAAKGVKARALHSVIADLWLSQVRGRSHVTLINIERALEAFHHLVASGNEAGIREIAVALIAARQEGALDRLWLLCNAQFRGGAEDKDLEKVLRYILHIAPNDHKALRFLGECIQRTRSRGDAEAISCFRRACELRPTYPPYLADLGVALLASGVDGASEFLSIVDHARKAHAQAINDVVVAVELDCLQTASPHTEEASTRRQQLIAAGTRHSAFFGVEANWLIGKNEPERALAVIDTAIARGCMDDVLTVLRAKALHAAGRDNEASEVRRSAIQHGSREPSVYLVEARWQWARRNFRAAGIVLEQLWAVGLDSDEATEIHAKILEATGRAALASSERRALIEKGTGALAIYHDEALWQLSQKRPDLGLDSLGVAERLHIDDDFTASIRASLLEAQGDGEGASHLRKTKIDEGSLNPAFYSAEALWLVGKRQCERALEILDLAEARGLGNEYIQSVRATALESGGRPDEASKVRTMMITSGSKYSPIYVAEAKAQLEAGEWGKVSWVARMAVEAGCSTDELVKIDALARARIDAP